MDTGNAVSEPERAIVTSKDDSTDVQLDIGNETTKELLNDSVMLLDVVTKVHHAQDEMCKNIYESGMVLSDFAVEEQLAWVVEILKTPLLLEEVKRLRAEIDTYCTPHGLNVWDEDPDYSRAEWREEVAGGNVTSGYWRWVSNQYFASE